MRFPLLSSLLISAALPCAFAEPLAEGSAYSALKLLPRGEAKQVARMVARDGTPTPERWYILVNDPKDENGLHEYVVAGNEIVASRNVSQFAEVIRPSDVYGGEPMRVDSDRAAQIAREYGDANAMQIASMNFELRKDGRGSALLWNVTCVNEAGKEFGHVFVTANKGTVVSHEGFTADPVGIVKEKPRPVAPVAANRTARAEPKPAPATAQAPAPEPARKPDFFHRLGGSMQKFFTGRDANGQ